MAWSGAAGLHYGAENYFAGSDYGKNLDYEKKREIIKNLTGQDFDPMGSNAYGMGRQNAASQEYRNLFEPVYAGRQPTGGYRLKADPWRGRQGRNATRAEELRNQLINEAYDQAINQNLFSHINASQEDYDKHLAEVGFEGTPGVDKWARRRNNLTGEEDWVLVKDERREGNFYRRYKDPIIIGGAGILGAAVGGPGGALLAASLARTSRETYKARQARREVRDARRDWENEQLALAEDQPQGGNLFRPAGEGVVEYATKDIENRRRGTLVRGQGKKEEET